MHWKDIFALRNNVLREATLTHFCVAAGVLLISTALATVRLGTTQAAELQAQTGQCPVPTAQRPAEGVGPLAGPAPVASPPVREGMLVSARGERTIPALSPSPAPAIDANPSPADDSAPATRPSSAVLSELATFDLPAPTPAPQSPVPAAAPPPPSPLPASSPTAAPTAAPTPAPAAQPKPAEPAQQLKVGIQAGHWKEAELPAELASLRGATGAAGNGWREVDVNLDVAQHVAAILKDKGILVDVLPATVPVAYKADAFVAIHGDANGNQVSGYKLARARWSKIPDRDDALVQAIYAEYGAATGMKTHNGSITEDMRQYYAFNWPHLQHAVASTTPSAIIELGFLTTPSDRGLLLGQPGHAADGVAGGILRFLGVK